VNRTTATANRVLMLELVLPLLACLSLSPPSRAPRLAPRVGRLNDEGTQRALVECPTPGCNTALRPGKLAAHLLRCPVLEAQRELEASGYWIGGVNTGRGEVTDEDTWAPIMMNSEAAFQLEERIGKAHTSCLGSALMHTAATADEADTTGVGVNERKRERHRAQRDVIVHELHKLGVIGQGHCIVEFGAGNGELSLAIAEAYPEACMRDALVLLDQGAKPRGKSGHGKLAADAALEQSWARFARVKLGIEDVDLAGIRATLAPNRTLVVIAKHLCGAASDFALRAVVAAGTSAASRPAAVVLGTCCHHRCDWAAYPNRPLLQDVLGSGEPFGGADFNLLCRLSSRGVNAVDLSPRAYAGRRAKDLLDHGRAAYLQQAGFDARLTTYVDASVTPENVLVVAKDITSRADGVRKRYM